MEEIGKKLADVPIDLVQMIRYEWVDPPYLNYNSVIAQVNYNAVIAQLKKQNIPVCGKICRFKCIVMKGNLYPPPVLHRSCHKECYCGRSIEDYNFTYCFAHAKWGTLEYEHYHRLCRSP